MLKGRTKGLIARIDRNVRTGFGVVVALVLFFLVDDFYLTPTFGDGVEVPFWIYLIDALNTFFLLGTFLYFWAQYRSVKKHYSQNNDMRAVLTSSVQLLGTFRRLFYSALSVLLLVIVVSALAGFFANPDLRSEEMLAERNQTLVFGSLAILLAIVALIFIVFSLGIPETLRPVHSAAGGNAR